MLKNIPKRKFVSAVLAFAGWMIAVIILSNLNNFVFNVSKDVIGTINNDFETTATTNTLSDTVKRDIAYQNKTHEKAKTANANVNHKYRTLDREAISKRMVRGRGTYKLRHPHGINSSDFEDYKIINGKRVRAFPLTWSQYMQDRFIDKLFDNKRRGFFVEVGAYDGETGSNTLLLERLRKWNGILIEANPYNFKSMLNLDRKCYMINSCVSRTEPELIFKLKDVLTSSINSIIVNNNTQERLFYEKITKIDDNHTGEEVTVRCFSLYEMLRVVGRLHVDYFSLDVEGGELELLKSIEWNLLTIDVFTVERDQNTEAVETFMELHDYVKIASLVDDDVYRHKQFMNPEQKVFQVETL